jgi:hypothetical protein
MARLEGKGGVSSSFALAVLLPAFAAFGANIPPVVTMGGYGMGPYSVSPGLTATDSDGSVVKVEWYANGQRLGESTWSQPPHYSYWWTNVPVGIYSITAVATDNEGATATSAPLEVEMKHPFGGQILTPTNGQVFVIGEGIPITCTLTNGDGTETLRYEYDYYNAGFPLLSNAPYAFTATAYSLGTHHIGGSAWQESWNPNRDAWLPRVKIHVVPARGFAVITTQPTNQIVPVGGDAVFSVSAFAELPLTYQWRFNGSDVPHATNAQLRLENVSPAHAGAYSVLVSTAAGVWPSDLAFLDVSRPSGGTVVFANYYASNGVVQVDVPVWNSDTNLEARIYAGTRMDRLYFVAGPVAVTNGYFDGGVINIPFVSPGERAYVRIFVRNPDDPKYQTAREWSNILETQTGGSDAPAPLVGLAFSAYPWPGPLTPDPFHAWDRRQLAAGTAAEPYRLAISIMSRAAKVTYQFEKDGRDIPGASGWCERTSEWRPMTCLAALTFTNLTLADAGSYRVRIDNGHSITFTAPVILGVIEPSRGRFVSITLGDSVCHARLHGRMGERYVVEASTNLRDWTPVTTVTNTDALIILPTERSGRQNFYRARLTQ